MNHSSIVRPLLFLVCASPLFAFHFAGGPPIRNSIALNVASKDVKTIPNRKRFIYERTDFAVSFEGQQQLSKPVNLSTSLRSVESGNLALIGDTWKKVTDEEHYEHLPTRRSTARIDTENSVDATTSNPGALSWSVKSDIQFNYKVVECPDLLHPSNDALLFGHLTLPDRIMAKTKAQRRLVVIDEHVDDLYGKPLRNYFETRGMRSGADYEILRLPMVEEEKSLQLVMEVCAAMKKFNIPRRESPIIAIGGGVCLDVVGLAATLFRRKTPYIRVPTTTLAYVDASVGAKSGVNFMGSKNRLGAYVPPVAALLDAQFLRTEETRAVSSGVAEMSKMAITKSPELFELLEAHSHKLVTNRFQPSSIELDNTVPARVLRLSIDTMLEELAPNLWEASLDRLVDFGHAIGQELEMHALGTPHELTHGESVNVDMAYMTVLARCRGLISEKDQMRILKMLSNYGCPIWSPLMTTSFLEHALSERRKLSMGLRLPLPTGIGEAAIFNDVTDQECLDALEIFHSLCGPEGSLTQRPKTHINAAEK